MKRVVLAALTSAFIFGSAATMASGNLESSLTPISAENISNWMSCQDKKPGDTVKSATRVENGKIVRVKCADVNKIVEEAQATSK
ncbi:MAG: hypothetical protein NMNS01_10160 [Nitrosomonas sp.]|jgi:Hypothetical protein NE1300|nr:MAG: hypothetical protein NMNS01_10160 [Nitrosomonas sp.]